jgi:NAD(P)H dehydrogenase (quinone)
MTKVLVLYYSSYGHTERIAQAVAEGVRETGAEADINRSSFNVAAAIDGVFS